MQRGRRMFITNGELQFLQDVLSEMKITPCGEEWEEVDQAIEIVESIMEKSCESI